MTETNSKFLCSNPNSIFGDNFSNEEIEKWYYEEENGYANLGYVDSETSYYPYHLMNERFGWSKIGHKLGEVLSLGGAYAAEFEKIACNITSITVVEPGKKFWRDEAYGLRLNYVVPNVDGHLDFDNQTFDTITAFGVLHHIPNVTYVFSELARVLKPGGNILLREPIISMGDWSVHRPGLTKNERSIPLSILGSLAEANDLIIANQEFMGFSPLIKLCKALHINFWSSRMLLNLDYLMCKLSLKNYKYHRETRLDRFAPSFTFIVLNKKVR